MPSRTAATAAIIDEHFDELDEIVNKVVPATNSSNGQTSGHFKQRSGNLVVGIQPDGPPATQIPCHTKNRQ